jgi:hypothetical protein
VTSVLHGALKMYAKMYGTNHFHLVKRQLNTPLIEMGMIMSVGIKKQRHYTSISYMLHEEYIFLRCVGFAGRDPNSAT